MNFSQRLRELRQTNDISQKKLAELIECSQSIICDYENEKSEPSLLMLAKLSKCFKVSIDYLVGNSSDDNLIVVNNNLSETENYLVQQLRLMNSEKKQELVSYANYLANKDNHKITNSQNIVDISDLSDIERAEVVGFINGFRKELFSHKYSKANTQSNNQNFTNNKNLNNIG